MRRFPSRLVLLIRVVAFLAFGTVGACDLQFTGIPQGEPTHLSAEIRAGEAGPLHLRFQAVLRPGRDDQGLVREVEDDTVWVMERPISPQRLGAGNVRHYEEDWTWQDDSSPVAGWLESPGLASQGILRLPIALARRTGADTIRVSPMDAVHLEVLYSRPPGAEEPAHSAWTIDVEGSDGARLLSLTFRHAAAGALKIPAEWVDADGWSGAEITLHARETWHLQHPDNGYRASLSVQSFAAWAVVVD